jgi:hypothetical protein
MNFSLSKAIMSVVPENGGDTTKTSTTMGDAVREFTKAYGPYTFGIVSLLVIWITIIAPVLERSALDFKELQNSIESLNTTINSQRSVLQDQGKLSEDMRKTSENLVRALETITEKR